MENNSGYPAGSRHDENAPYNIDTKKINVLVSVILSKTVELEVSYDSEDIPDFILKEEVEKQVNIPHEGWEIDNVSVIKE